VTLSGALYERKPPFAGVNEYIDPLKTALFDNNAGLSAENARPGIIASDTP
jgi:hypothetical protein